MASEQLREALQKAAEVGDLVRKGKIEYDPVEKIGPMYCYDCIGHIENKGKNKMQLSFSDLGPIIHQTYELIDKFGVQIISNVTAQQNKTESGIWMGDVEFRHAYIDFTTGKTTLFSGNYIQNEDFNRESLIKFLVKKIGIKGCGKKQHIYYHHKKFSPQYVFDNCIGDHLHKHSIELENGRVRVKPNSSRYKMFQEKGLACSVCGYEATHARLCITDQRWGIAHFAFFDTDETGKEILFHRHYRIPMSQGGGKELDNIVPICNLCNNLLEGS